MLKKRSDDLWGSLGSEVPHWVVYFVRLLGFKWGSEQNKAVKLVHSTSYYSTI